MYLFFRKLLSIFFHIRYRINVMHPENIPSLKGGYIIACNHQRYADPPMVAAVIRGKFSFMAKEELFEKKMFGWLIRKLGAFPVARGKGDSGVIDTAVENLEKRSMMIFPEGTRSKDGKVGRGHTGAALIAARSGKLIVPVGVTYEGELKFRRRVTVKYGEPIDPAEYVEICDEPNPRKLVRLKNRYMAEIKKLVEGDAPQSEADGGSDE